ncbi:hypothetical protein EBU95_03955 [bacterium]|nr:hypothetical protein [bacterium]
MNKLITDVGDVSQTLELARIFVLSMKDDVNKMNYQSAIKNYAKLSSIVQDLNKKMLELKKTVEELEKLSNGLQ